VKLDAITVMKLIKQANNSYDGFQIGYLQGIIEEETVEVTNCFPILTDLDVVFNMN
jgi:hypothetical protein